MGPGFQGQVALYVEMGVWETREAEPMEDGLRGVEPQVAEPGRLTQYPGEDGTGGDPGPPVRGC